MERLPRPFVACGLGLLLAAAGCRSTKPEVPPGRPFAKDGQQRPAIDFSTNGHPVNGAATATLTPNNLGGSDMASGIGMGGARPDAAAFGAPPGAYGPPGTAGMAPGTSDPATSRASEAPAEMPPASMPRLETPPTGSPTFPGQGGTQTGEMPNQIVIPPIDNPGKTGTPDQAPSPM